MYERSEDDVAAGVIRAQVGRGVRAEVILVPTLTTAETRPWKAALAKAAVGIGVGFDMDNLASAAGLSDLADETIMALVLGYDQGGLLGGQERLERDCDPAQVYRIFRLMLGVAYPYVRDIGQVMQVLLPLLQADAAAPSPAAPPALAQSTNGPSPSGDLTPVG